MYPIIFSSVLLKPSVSIRMIKGESASMLYDKYLLIQQQQQETTILNQKANDSPCPVSSETMQSFRFTHSAHVSPDLVHSYFQISQNYDLF
mmetsp:Transcript_42099/g.71951  ORF Transcript_42099/g.71951 Transcript_42099/m.71951 type:complete len:91 (-) Transcript_42099:200-472(-)